MSKILHNEIEIQRRYRTGSTSTRRLTGAALAAIVDQPMLQAEHIEFIDGVTTLDVARPHSLLFLEAFREDWIDQAQSVETLESCLVIASEGYRGYIKSPAIFTPAVRPLYAKIVTELFGYRHLWSFEATTAGAQIDPGAEIAPGAIVAASSRIGRNSLLMPNVVIGPNCRIGQNVVIHSGAVIGMPGFGVFRNEIGDYTHMPHVGGVVIEDDVEIGSSSNVSAGTIHPTVIGRNAKIDALVHIAHNVVVGANTLIIALSEISGSVVIGQNVWVGPSSSIIDGITIGDRVTIGIGSNLIRSVPADTTVYGNPAKPSYLK
jgi:UDP-3-O-[3-hydroxymyristoyl] glucosamine N-acyltransferase LpxD